MTEPIALNENERSQIMQYSVPQFVSLQTLEIVIGSDWIEDHGDEFLLDRYGFMERRNCELRCQYIFHFAAHLKNLRNVKFRGHKISKVHKILEFSPNIRTMTLSNATMLNWSKEIQNIVETLRVNRESNNRTQHRLLHLMVEKDEWHTLQANEEVEGILTSSIKHGFKYKRKHCDFVEDFSTF